MSIFFAEDTVALKEDPSILGTIDQTWSEIDQGASDASDGYSCRKDVPPEVRRTFSRQGKLLPGYVVVEFMNDCDGFCLIQETSLQLVDRGLAVGDIVKRKASDWMSGTVLSTSMQCTLTPVCTMEKFQRIVDIAKLSQYSSPDSNCQQCQTSSTSSLSFDAPASELKDWGGYREEDFIFFRGWVGQITDLVSEVTIRLTNGSVVTVDDAEALEVPCFYEDSPSAHFSHRLHRAGVRLRVGRKPSQDPTSLPTNGCCHPGQIVQTKKANLRLGRWKFGAYDPNVEPYGLVVESRCIEMIVEWIFPNILAERQSHSVPSDILDTDDIDSGDIIVYDRSRPSNRAIAQQLQGASYSPDTGFGRLVRFRDPVGTAPNYNGMMEDSANRYAFDRIPRAASQGFDMNVLEVSKTRTQVLVQWQDGTTSKEAAATLVPYLNPDEHEVWPGDRVSHVPSESKSSDPGLSLVLLRKVGIVESVSKERIARVRWFQDSLVELDATDKVANSPLSRYGPISNSYDDMTLYELAAHPGLEIRRGNMVLVLPEVPRLIPSDFKLFGDRYWNPQSTRDPSISRVEPVLGLEDHQTGLFDHAMARVVRLQTEASSVAEEAPHIPSDSLPGPQTQTIFGEVVDICLDGDVVVRFGASTDAPELKVHPDRAMVISSGDTRDSDEDSEWTDDGEGIDIDDRSSEDGKSVESSTEAIDMDIEYEGGEKLDISGDDDAWVTDEDQKSMIYDNKLAKNDSDGSDTGSRVSLRSDTNRDSNRTLVASIRHSTSMPPNFGVLDEQCSDHRFVSDQTRMTGDLVRRITKEHKILSSSLPDGVFVRSWESRLDLLRILIIGPAGTPYEYAPFVIDMQFRSSFPAAPPEAFFYSWTNNAGRINPNLYEDGKICLSLLGTWPSDKSDEGWSATKSTVLQIIVSLMGLVLVKEPYYNEAGYEVLINTPESLVPSALYSEKAYVLAKGFINTALTRPLDGLKDVIEWLYLGSQGPSLLMRVIRHCRGINSCSSDTGDGIDSAKMNGEDESWGKRRISAGALIMLRKYQEGLESIAVKHTTNAADGGSRERES